MASPKSSPADAAAPHGPEVTRRDFLFIATGAVAAVGAGAVAWPFIHQMNPAADVLALSSIEVNLSAIEEGQAVTVKWRGKPVFIRHRTAEEIREAETTPLSALKDDLARNDNLPARDEASDANRRINPAFMVVVGVCTHLGCVPLGTAQGEVKGEYNGWFCPCHGSHYDTAGRIRKGPAPENLPVPTYQFVTDTVIRIG